LLHFPADDHTLYTFTPAAFAMAADKPDAARAVDDQSPERSTLLPPKPDALLNPKSLDHLVPAKRESSMLHPRYGYDVSAAPLIQFLRASPVPLLGDIVQSLRASAAAWRYQSSRLELTSCTFPSQPTEEGAVEPRPRAVG
jgi:hypothetical protein